MKFNYHYFNFWSFLVTILFSIVISGTAITTSSSFVRNDPVLRSDVSILNQQPNNNVCSKIPEPPAVSIVASAQYGEELQRCMKSQHMNGHTHHGHTHHGHTHHGQSHHGQSHIKGNKGTLIGHKIGALLLMIITAVLGCAIPLFLRGTKIFIRIMTYVNSFACGAFLGLAFFHLLPESLYLTKSAKLGFHVGHNWYNLLFPLSFAGFVLILFFEKVLLVEVKSEAAIVDHCHGKKKDHDVEDCKEEKLKPHVNHFTDISGKGDTLKESLIPVHHFSPLSLLATLSLSLHSVFEGVIVGTFDEGTSVWIATFSICGHKWAAGFALAANCVRANVSPKASWIYLSIFIISSPIGVLFGIAISATNYAFIGVIDAISLGAILYTGCDLLFTEFGTSSKVSKELLKFLWLLIGAFIVFGLFMAHIACGSHSHSE